MANIHFMKTNEAIMLDRDYFVNGMAFIILDFLSTLVDVDSRARGHETPTLTLLTSETRQILFFLCVLGHLQRCDLGHFLDLDLFHSFCDVLRKLIIAVGCFGVPIQRN